MRFGRVYSRRRRLMSCSRRWMTRRHATFCLFFQRANYRLRNGLSGGYCSHLYGCGISGKAGRKLGVNVYVEKQGANGIEGRLTADQLNSATACIFAAEVAIKESERFNGIPALSVRVAEPIRHAEALMQQALTLKRSDETRTVQQDTQPVKSVKRS